VAPEVEKREQLYEGKAKRIYRTSLDNQYWVEYKDDATAFNGEKKATITGKGELNNRITAIFFTMLKQRGIDNHFIRLLSPTEQLVRQVEIIPLEVVVRNIAAGSLSKRLGMKEGTVLPQPVVEFYYKDDALGDPLVNPSHIKVMGIASEEDLAALERLGLMVNDVLQPYLRERGILLVDFKLEFGRTPEGEILLADEISPDTCRFWDAETGEKLDKDRFRRDLGKVEEAYQEMLKRLGGEAHV
jgi:phosphoribosylaminoimidazole-succinocarboxamide synthase